MTNNAANLLILITLHLIYNTKGGRSNDTFDVDDTLQIAIYTCWYFKILDIVIKIEQQGHKPTGIDLR